MAYCRFYVKSERVNTVEPLYSGHLRFLEKVSLLSSVRYIEVFNISRRKGKKDTLIHNNVLNHINTPH